MNNTSKTIIPIFSDTVYTKCPKCGQALPLLSSHNPLTDLGFFCESCGSRFIVLRCPFCHAMEIVGSVEWDQIRNRQSFVCNTCGEQSSIPVKEVRLRLSPILRQNLLIAWSERCIEHDYIIAIKKIGGRLDLNKIAQIHGAIGSRFKNIHSVLNKISENKIATFKMYNNSGLAHSGDVDDVDIEYGVFQICNALVSAIEMLTQEVVAVLCVDWSEKDVGFNKAVSAGVFRKNSTELHSIFCKLKGSPEFIYLSKLRNCIHHRWSVPVSIESDYIIDFPGAIYECSYGGVYTVFLPDDPEVSISDMSFSQRRKLLPQFKEIAEVVEEFMIDVYKELIVLLGR